MINETLNQKVIGFNKLRKARIIDLRRCPSVLRMGGETDSDGFVRTVFDLYFFDGCGRENQSTARPVGGAAVYCSQTSYYATSLSDRIRRLFISLLPAVMSSRSTGVVTWVIETHFITMNSLSNAIYSLEKANLSPSW